MFFMSVLLGATSLQAQDIRANLYGAYVFDDKIDSYYSSSNYYEGKIKGGLQWGGGIEYMVRRCTASSSFICVRILTLPLYM
jgi:hypothetical protein